jgi:hypothetical protein
LRWRTCMTDKARYGLPEEPDDDECEPSEGNGEREARRRQLIAAAQDSWIAALTDLGGRNTLLYYKDRRAGTLDLGKADAEALARFLRSGSIRLGRLFTDVDLRADAIRRVQAIYRRSTELLEERGIRAGYLATGLARWDELFLEPAAPVLLRGLTIVPTRARHDDFELVLDDDTEVNPVLLNKLATAFGAATEELADESPDAIGGMLIKAAEAAEIPGFEIIERRVIGTFTYAKLPMVRDLQAADDVLNDSDVVAAIAGDPDAQERTDARPARAGLLGAGRGLLPAQRDQHGAVRPESCHPRPAGHGQEPDHREPHRGPGGARAEGPVRGRKARGHRRGAVAAQERPAWRHGPGHPRWNQGPDANLP